MFGLTFIILFLESDLSAWLLLLILSFFFFKLRKFKMLFALKRKDYFDSFTMAHLLIPGFNNLFTEGFGSRTSCL